MLLTPLVILCLFKAIEGVRFNSYTGTRCTEKELEYYKQMDNLMNCTNDIVMPCDPNERRRGDGSCNNLKKPSVGAYHTPMIRLLKANYSTGSEDRLSCTGRKLPLPRKVRTELLATGTAKHSNITQLLVHTSTVLFVDIASVHDSLHYLLDILHCCTEEGKSDPWCTPVEIPVDDPVFRYSGHRCMNLTKPKSFQSYGCKHNFASPLERIEMNTQMMDLSFIYHASEPAQEVRSFSNGMLKVDVDEGGTWPPNDGPHSGNCLANVASLGEDKCFGMASPTIPPATYFTVWYHRLHNSIASKLSLINPCWDDDRLFETARDINIAISMEIGVYEMLPVLFGAEYWAQSPLKRSDDEIYRNIYDDSYGPQVTYEFQVALRYMHLLTAGKMKLYDENYHYVKQEPIMNHTLRVGFIRKDDHLRKICRGAIKDPAAGGYRLVDPDMGNLGFGGLQDNSDIVAKDLQKNRALGFTGFQEYIEYFTGERSRTWEDLNKHIPKEVVEIIQELYECPSDLDLMAGIWVSNVLPGGVVPPMVAYMVEDQILRSIKSDRHWHEYENRPFSYTKEQLLSLRKVTIASMMCEVGGIEKVQPQAFYRPSADNRMVSCDKIPKLDLNLWKDPKCQCSDE